MYDQGRDEVGPHYTMELRDGTDLRERAPLPWQEVCRVLHDVASSLALVHARGLVHRDVSPGNVRITSDGRAKLLDFGTIAPAGKQQHVAGTAPCLAPEALAGGDVDAAVDLYALGASAYFALCGKFPYPARSFGQLAGLWAAGRPRPPSQLCPGVPRELDEVVLSLLAQHRLARPALPVLLDQLAALAALTDDHDERVVASYLQRPPLSGHAALLRHALSAIAAASTRGPLGVVVSAGSGLGKSSFLRAVQDEARLLGIPVLASHGRLHASPYSLCRELIRQGVRMSGQQVREQLPPQLAALAEGASLPSPAATASSPRSHEASSLRAGFADALRSLCERGLTLLCVDAAAHADPPHGIDAAQDAQKRRSGNSRGGLSRREGRS